MKGKKRSVPFLFFWPGPCFRPGGAWRRGGRGDWRRTGDWHWGHSHVGTPCTACLGPCPRPRAWRWWKGASGTDISLQNENGDVSKSWQKALQQELFFVCSFLFFCLIYHYTGDFQWISQTRVTQDFLFQSPFPWWCEFADLERRTRQTEIDIWFLISVSRR